MIPFPACRTRGISVKSFCHEKKKILSPPTIFRIAGSTPRNMHLCAISFKRCFKTYYVIDVKVSVGRQIKVKSSPINRLFQTLKMLTVTSSINGMTCLFYGSISRAYFAAKLPKSLRGKSYLISGKAAPAVVEDMERKKKTGERNRSEEKKKALTNFTRKLTSIIFLSFIYIYIFFFKSEKKGHVPWDFGNAVAAPPVDFFRMRVWRYAEISLW